MRRILLLIALLPPLACSGDAKKAEDKAAAAAEKKAADAKQEAAPPEPEKPAVDPALHDDYDKLCNAAERSGSTEDMDPSARAVKIADWIKTEVKSKQVLDLMASLATMSPESRGPALRNAAKAAGVEPCPLADES